MEEHNGLILPSFDFLNSFTQDIRDLTNPLRQLGISMFSHTRIYNDHSFIDISDREDMLDLFYYQSDIYKYYTPDVNPWMLKQGFLLCSSLGKNPSILALRDNLNIDNLIVLLEKHDDHCRLWHFGSEVGNEKILQYYLNHLHVLKSFAYFFDEQAESLINSAATQRIIRPEDISIETSPPACSIMPGNNIDISRYITREGLKLYYKKNYIRISKCEIKIIKGILCGYTNREIADYLKRSPHTVAHHIENIKEKFQCRRTAEITRILIELDLAKSLLETSDF